MAIEKLLEEGKLTQAHSSGDRVQPGAEGMDVGPAQL